MQAKPEHAEGSSEASEVSNGAGARPQGSRQSDSDSNVLSAMLEEKSCLFADGATGTNLMIAGLGAGRPPDFWNTENPEPLEALQRDFVAAGSDILLTNTFGSNALRLKLNSVESRCRDLNLTGTHLARVAADCVDRQVLVAGCIGPTGEMMQPLGIMTADEAYACYAEQAAALAEGGVDIIWIETIFAFDELGAAVRAAATTDLPTVATMTFDTNGHTMMGDTPEAAMAYVQDLPDPPVAFGANCGAGPSMLIDSVVRLKRAADPEMIIIAKGNCGVPELTKDGVVFTGTAEVMEKYARLARDAGARIIGGCCGTTAEILKVMIDAIREYEPGLPPDTETIEAVLGPMLGPRVADFTDLN